MAKAEACSKCGEEPRAKGSPWGKACLAVKAKERRGRRRIGGDATGDATSAPDATRDATGDAEPPVASVSHDVASLTATVERLEGELAAERTALVAEREAHALDVKVFEEQLAGVMEISKGKDNTIVTLTAQVGKLEERLAVQERTAQDEDAEPHYVRRPQNMPAPKKGLGGQYTPHGDNCQCVGCRAARVSVGA